MADISTRTDPFDAVPGAGTGWTPGGTAWASETIVDGVFVLEESSFGNPRDFADTTGPFTWAIGQRVGIKMDHGEMIGSPSVDVRVRDGSGDELYLRWNLYSNSGVLYAAPAFSAMGSPSIPIATYDAVSLYRSGASTVQVHGRQSSDGAWVDLSGDLAVDAAFDIAGSALVPIFSVYNNAGELARVGIAGFNVYDDTPPVTADRLAITTQPANADSGDTLAAIVVEAHDADADLDTSEEGDVTADLLSWPAGENEPVLHGTLTKAMVGGVATFNDLSLNLVGTGYSLRFTHATLTQADSDTFDITLPAGGGGTTFLRGGTKMQKPMTATASAAQRTLYFWLRAADGAVLGSVTGKASFSVNGAAAANSTNNIATAGPTGRYKVEVAAAELPSAGTHIEIVPWGSAAFVEGEVSALAVAVDIHTAPPTDADIADAVAAQTDIAGAITAIDTNLDAQVSTRASSVEAAALDALIDAVGTSVDLVGDDAATLVGRLTSTRAGNLDRLDANVSEAGGGLTTAQEAKVDGLVTDLLEVLRQVAQTGAEASHTPTQSVRNLTRTDGTALGTLTITRNGSGRTTGVAFEAA